MRVECKCTIKDSFRVTLDTLRKLSEGTFGSGEIPVIQVELGVREGKAKGRVYIVPAEAMEDMLERLTREPTGNT